MSSDSSVAFVTGSTRGLGLAVARRLIADGWRVAVNGRSEEIVRAVADGLGDRAIPCAGDVTDGSTILAALANVARESSRLDAVVHSAGIMQDAPLGMIADEQIARQLSVNVAASISVTQSAVRVMSRFKKGSVVLFGSVAGEDGSVGQVAYAATKAAIGGVVRSAAKEAGPRGIRVNGVVPGVIDTDLNAGLSVERREELASLTPLRRIGEPEDVADVVAFLVSEGARFVTGSMLRVDGGLHLT